MAHGGFLNDNLFRAYPCVYNQAAVGLPESAIADFGCMMLHDSGFVDDQHMVYVRRIARTGTTFTFEFQSDAPGLMGIPIIFTRTTTQPRFVTDDVEVLEDYEPTELSCQSGLAIVDCYMTSGDMTLLMETLPDGTNTTFNTGAYRIEPAQIQNLAMHGVRSINVANRERTRYQPDPAGCSLSSLGYLGPRYDPDKIHVNGVCMTGNVKLVEGYNCVIRQDSKRNQITIAGSLNGGAGQPQREIQSYPGEVPPRSSRLLTGGPRCDEVLHTINGMSGSVIKFEAGAGVSIIQDPLRPERLIVDADLQALATCPSQPLLTSRSSSLSGI